MRDEDLDWEIYHALPDDRFRAIADLVAAGHDPALVEASLGRLERYHLVERRGGEVRALSLPESILVCQSRNEEDSPIVFEKGVIRVRTMGERKDP